MASPPPYPPINAEPRSVIAAMVETGHEAHAEALAGAILVLPSLGRDQVSFLRTLSSPHLMITPRRVTTPLPSLRLL